MRLLVDENVGGGVVRLLQEAGHDVVAVKDIMGGAPDADVLGHAQHEQRVLITFDKDFGELAVRLGRSAAAGVILLRLPMANPAVVAIRICAVVGSRDDWTNHYAVVDERKIRLRPLPPARGREQAGD